jgi:hypothetical protein
MDTDCDRLLLMSIRDNQPPQEPPWDAPGKKERLFDRCVKMQVELDQASPQEIARQALFDERKLPMPPKPEATEPWFYRERYLELVEQLRLADDDMLWYWLGQWFKSEGIRAPEKIVPLDVAKRLLQEGDISGADICNARVVRIWLPYTEPLVRKTRWLRQDNAGNIKKRLKELGYDSAAIKMVAGLRRWESPVEFTCEWVASRSTEYQRETLVNSYSRYLKRWWSEVNKCSFCRAEADGEFWVREESIPYCQLHRPDLLPLSEDSAWTDRRGRRWWRQNLDIRRIPPRSSF